MVSALKNKILQPKKPVHFTAPAAVRVSRVHQREYEAFGNRALKGGDMYESHRHFLDDVASYESGGGFTSVVLHRKWADSLKCQVLRLDGSDERSRDVSVIAEKYRYVCKSLRERDL